MRVAVEFTRGDQGCCHAEARQCTYCFKREMAQYLGLSEEEFEAEWRGRIGRTEDDDVVESYTSYELYGVDLEKVERRKRELRR